MFTKLTKRVVIPNRFQSLMFTQKNSSLVLNSHLLTSRISRKFLWLLSGVAVAFAIFSKKREATTPDEFEAVRKELRAVMENTKYDDGSYGPVLVRLAWHAAGTYDKSSNTGGSDGATMRFDPESNHGANKGLDVARKLLEPVQKKHPHVSTADMWILAGLVAIEEMGGPKIPFKKGRTDKPDGTYCPPDGRLPDASQGAKHIRDVFYRMGFNDQEIVALIGAHALGRCHPERSGYSGPWTHSPTTFSNDFYVQLLERKWTKKNWKGPEQYEDETKTLMMLPTDIALITDPTFRKWVQVYAKDEEKFFNDFSKAFQKLIENGTSGSSVKHS